MLYSFLIFTFLAFFPSISLGMKEISTPNWLSTGPYSNQTKCSICWIEFSDIESGQYQKFGSCGHWICSNCSTIEIENCPLCRNPMPIFAYRQPTEAEIERFVVAVAKNDSSTIDSFLQGLLDVNVTNRAGMTALQVALYKNNPEIVELLLQRGPEISSERCWPSVLSLLDSSHLEPAVRKIFFKCVNTSSTNLSRILAVCVKSAEIEELEFLVQRMSIAEALQTYSEHYHVAWAAMERQDISIIRLLYRAGLNFNSARDYAGRTLLFDLVYIEFSEAIITELIENCHCDVQARSYKGRTLLHAAAKHACANDLAKLLRYDLEINVKDNFGDTPLHLVVNKLLSWLVWYWRCSSRFGSQEMDYIVNEKIQVIRLLLENGADFTIQNIGHQTPLDIVKNAQELQPEDQEYLIATLEMLQNEAIGRNSYMI